MDDHQPRIIARGEWEQDENGDLLYIPRHKAPPMGDARGNRGPWQEGRDPDDLPVEEYEPGDATDPHIVEALAAMRAERAGAALPDHEADGARGGYRRASDAVWARARADYLGGDAAETVCLRHGLALSTLRQRARAEGWRRQDQVDPEPVDLEVEIEAGLPDYGDIARHALVRMNRAVLAGRAPEAAGWMRIHRQMLDLARAETASEPPPPRPDRVPDPTPDPMPDPMNELMLQLREVESIAREAVTIADDDLEGRRRVLARAAALETRPISHHSHHSDGVFPQEAVETDARVDAPP